MWLRKAAHYMEPVLSAVVPVAGRIGAVVIAVMMLLTVADVIGRKFFNEPIPGSFEFSKFMLVIVSCFTLAATERMRRHVKVGLLLDRLGQRTQDIIDSITYLVSLGMFSFLTYHLWLYAMMQMQHGVYADIVGGPDVITFPFILAGALGSALLSLVVLMHLLLFLAGALKR